jgi:putative membrane protein
MRGEAVEKGNTMYWNDDFGWAGWLAMTLGMAGFWVLVALLILTAVRPRRGPNHEDQDPRQILERRLARGEIDVEEYRERLAALAQVPR